jgi:hypothetical protein
VRGIHGGNSPPMPGPSEGGVVEKAERVAGTSSPCCAPLASAPPAAEDRCRKCAGYFMVRGSKLVCAHQPWSVSAKVWNGRRVWHIRHGVLARADTFADHGAVVIYWNAAADGPMTGIDKTRHNNRPAGIATGPKRLTPIWIRLELPISVCSPARRTSLYRGYGPKFRSSCRQSRPRSVYWWQTTMPQTSRRRR